jgi:hypothetical protein
MVHFDYVLLLRVLLVFRTRLSLIMEVRDHVMIITLKKVVLGVIVLNPSFQTLNLSPEKQSLLFVVRSLPSKGGLIFTAAAL